jgi:hypothetical protein
LPGLLSSLSLASCVRMSYCTNRYHHTDKEVIGSNVRMSSVAREERRTNARLQAIYYG